MAALLAVLAACGTTKVQPGYYRVQSGDTLTQIARKQGVSVGDLVRWNKLSNSNAIEVGQTLRVEAPPASRLRPSPAGRAPSPQAAGARPRRSRRAGAPRRRARSRWCGRPRAR
ncbi:LysM domain-containing protein [Achromobacter xylosoxidans]